jgi:hypothetical protein
VHTGFWWEDLREGDHLEDPSWEGDIKMDLQEVGWGMGAWMAQDRDRWQALMNVVMNLWVP